MDYFGNSPSSTASSSTLVFIDESSPVDDRSLPPKDQSTTQLSTPPSGPTGVRETSRQHWESLKPLIKQVYIDENKPFPYLAEILRTQHGFEPTKRQFSRKIVEWGFRKYVSSSERHDILNTLPNPDQKHQLDLQANDPRLKPEKLRNWRKRYGAEASNQSNTVLQAPGYKETVSEITCESSLAPGRQAISFADSQQMHIAQPLLGYTTTRLLAERQESCETAFETLSWEFWPDNWTYWASVDVPNSPGLSRLFEALEVECSNPVPPLSLDTVDLEDPPCISGNEIQDLFNDENKTLSRKPANALSHQRGSVCNGGIEKTRKSHSAREGMGAVFFGYNASPLNELYAFPPPPSPSINESSEVLAINQNIWTSLAAQEMELEDKLAKLTPLCGGSHPKVLEAMGDLSRLYYDRRRYKDAEQVDRDLMDLYIQTGSGTELEILDAYQRVVDALVAQGKYLQAKALNRHCHSAHAIVSHVGTPRVAHAIFVDALIAEELGYTEEAESLHRQVLQIWLTYCGPRDKRTLNSMTQLGYIFALTRRPEGEKLLRTSVELHLEGSVAADEDACRAMTNLSAAFWAQDTHEEGCDIAKTALNRFLPSLGNEHPDILATKVALARNMTKAGKLSESEKLFREIVAVESSLKGGIEPAGLSNSSYGLARVLTMKGCLDEAIELYDEVFNTRVWSYGWDHRYTLRVCYDLGECYQKNGCYDDAIAFYQNVIDELWKIGSAGNSYHPDIDDLESCVKDLKAQKLKSRPPCSGNNIASKR